MFIREKQATMPIPKGRHELNLRQIHDQGFQPGYDGGDSQLKMVFVFEAPVHSVPGMPAMVMKTMTQSLHAKASLRPIVEALLGRELKPGEGRKFELSSLLNRWCQADIELAMSSRTSRTFPKIVEIKPSNSKAKHPECQAESFIFSLDPKEFSVELFEQLPAWEQDAIIASSSWDSLQKGLSAPAATLALQAPDKRSTAEIIDDDIGF